jgi:glycosyltransferase involved in cell wall biosynthesis
MEVLRVRFRRRPVSSIAPLLQRLDIGDGANFPEQRTGSTTVQLREAWQTITSLRRTLGHADLLVAPSQFILDVHRACGLSRFTLNRNAAPVEAASVTRRDPVSGPLRFGFMGGTNVWKGVRLALEAMQLFEPREAELHIWGAENAPTEPSALGPNIHWRGRLPAERRLEAYAEMDVLMALSLHHENSPMNVIEAQATRAPVIATRVGGHMELIREGEDGFLVTRDDFKALVAAMRRLVEDRALARSMSERAPQRPLGNEMAQRLLDEFKRLAKSGVT